MTEGQKAVEAYLKNLPEDRREALEEVRKVVLANVPKGIEEGIQYGMIGYYVPHELYPKGYHCDPKQPLPFLCIASQKNHMVIHLFCAYCNPIWRDAFIEDYQASGKKLDMGAACVRFKKLDDLPLDVLKRTLKKIQLKPFIAEYEKMVPAPKKQAATTSKKSAKVAKKVVTAKKVAKASAKGAAKSKKAKPSKK